MKRAGGLIAFALTFSFLNNTILAQNEPDVLRYSWTEYLG